MYNGPVDKKRGRGRPPKLTDAQRKEIARRFRNECANALALEFGVGKTTVYNIAAKDKDAA